MFSSVRNLTLAFAAAGLALSVSACTMPSADASAAQKKKDKCAPPVFPDVTPPTVVDWDGAPLVIAPHTVFILDPDPQVAGAYIAYQVEWQTPAVPAAVRVQSAKLPLFIDDSQDALLGIRNPPPPPPPIIDLMQGLLRLGEVMDENAGY